MWRNHFKHDTDFEDRFRELRERLVELVATHKCYMKFDRDGYASKVEGRSSENGWKWWRRDDDDKDRKKNADESKADQPDRDTATDHSGGDTPVAEIVEPTTPSEAAPPTNSGNGTPDGLGPVVDTINIGDVNVPASGLDAITQEDIQLGQGVRPGEAALPVTTGGGGSSPTIADLVQPGDVAPQPEWLLPETSITATSDPGTPGINDLYLPGEKQTVPQGISTSTNTSGSLIDLDDMRADPRFAHLDGSGVSVAIVDTGIDLNHPFFGPDTNFDGIADRIVYQYDFSGSNDSDASDFDDHGSNVASIVGSQDATFGGMAPGADLIVLKVFTDGGAGSSLDLEEALSWLAANGSAYNLAAVNMSLGFSNNDSTAQTYPGNSLFDEMASLASQGVAVVSAAGNDYYAYQTQGVSYPASDPSSWAVSSVWDSNVGGVGWSGGATDFTTGADRIVSHSQRSQTLTDIFAPGAFITGANASGGTVSMGGTSQAAPHISGIVALAQQLSMEITGGTMLAPSTMLTLMQNSAASIYDGDDENDNVVSTNAFYDRVDVDDFMDAVYDHYNVVTGGGDLLRGANGQDDLAGLGGNDTMWGRGGDDTLDGGTGIDQAGFAGDRADFRIQTINDGGTIETLVIDAVGSEGTDTLIDIETLEFDGGATFSLTGANLNRTANVVGSRYDDVVFHNDVSGQSFVNTFVDGALQGSGALTGANGAIWDAVDTADMNSDGIADVIYQNSADGSIAIGTMSAAGVTGYTYLTDSLSTTWRLVGAADTDGDIYTDLVIQNTATGFVYSADFTDLGFNGYTAVSDEGTSWEARALGDVDANGVADIIYQNTLNGDVVAGLMTSAGSLSSYQSIASVGAWTVKEAADVNADGYADVLIQNDANGDISYANMSGGAFSGYGTVMNGFGTAWQLEGMADTNNDGDADAIIRNVLGSGDTYVVNMENGAFDSFTLVAQGIGSDWYVV